MARQEPGSAKTPMHMIISEKLRKQIQTGVYAPGDQLPSEFDLGQSFGVSRTTVRRAIATLIRLGLVSTQQGKGIFVKPQNKISFSLANPLTFFDSELAEQGITGSIQTIKHEPIHPAPEIRMRLKLAANCQTIYLQEKLILADDEPIAIDLAHFPEEIGRSLKKAQTEFTYRSLAVNGYDIESAEVSLESRPASYDVRDLLEVPLGSPLLVYHYLAWDRQKQPLVYGETISRADRTYYSVGLKRSQLGI